MILVFEVSPNIASAMVEIQVDQNLPIDIKICESNGRKEVTLLFKEEHESIAHKLCTDSITKVVKALNL